MKSNAHLLIINARLIIFILPISIMRLYKKKPTKLQMMHYNKYNDEIF